jgi:predicted hydrocarbon binding protein
MALAPMLKKMLIGNAFMTDRGRVKMFENMEYTLFPSRALALNLQKVGKKGGEKYLFDLGYKTTTYFDKELMETIHLSGTGSETANKIKPIFDILGWGTFEYVKKEYSKNNHHFIVRLYNNPISDHAKRLFGNDSKVCSFLLGMQSAHTKIIFGVDVEYKETKCVTKGDPYCEFVSKR